MSTSLVLEPPSSAHSVKSFAANFSAISPTVISALVSRRSTSSGGSPEPEVCRSAVIDPAASSDFCKYLSRCNCRINDCLSSCL
ncbi:hypothetical protein ACS0PU_010319 [Formica fusca]